MFTVFSSIKTQLLAPTDAWSGVAGNLSALVLSPVLVGVSIVIFWHGFNILRGAHGAHHMLDIFAKLIRSFLVVALAISAGAYTSNVIGVFNDLRTGLTGLFIPGGAANSYAALDAAMEAVLSTWDGMWLVASHNVSVGIVGPTDISGILMLIGWIVLAVALAIFCALCAFNLIFIDFSLALMFALGPMFIACMAFPSTSRFADGWISGVLKYVLTAVCVAAVVGLGVGILKTYTDKMVLDPSTINFILVAINGVIASVVLGLFVSKMPQVAADMVGGAALNLLTPRDGVAAAMRMMNIPKAGQGSTNGGIEKALERQFGPPQSSGGGGSNAIASGTGTITSGRDSLGVQAATGPSSMPPYAVAAAATAMAAASTTTPTVSQENYSCESQSASSSSPVSGPPAVVITAPMTSPSTSGSASNQVSEDGPILVPTSASHTAAQAASAVTTTPAPAQPVTAATTSTESSFSQTSSIPPPPDFTAAATAVSLGRPVGSTHTPGKA
ncbi:type IV secretion system protein [Variovorax sp. LG9.2]|uniref:type IV secretion system protein n=1 Tax=Variovorax sp. LG9.2 TaxID=3048626 RepID=UPI002B22A198|nr:type IV secretion system protein [Variovorax sp. LG9.2]MEB0059312.1 type IV secretion system protein [Variovorax sp. LG9.2]